jgi:hypothetical protein
MKDQTWRVKSVSRDYEWEGPLVAYWEVENDPISDDYTPGEISADDLLRKWAKAVEGKFTSDLIPIHWFVESPGKAKIERMPFQFNHHPSIDSEPKDFLSYYSWPVNAKTGERLNWLAIPVVNKQWNTKQGDKGGFIQEATGWKPAILQPFVHLPTLLKTRG